MPPLATIALVAPRSFCKLCSNARKSEASEGSGAALLLLEASSEGAPDLGAAGSLPEAPSPTKNAGCESFLPATSPHETDLGSAMLDSLGLVLLRSHAISAMSRMPFLSVSVSLPTFSLTAAPVASNEPGGTERGDTPKNRVAEILTSCCWPRSVPNRVNDWSSHANVLRHTYWTRIEREHVELRNRHRCFTVRSLVLCARTNV